MTTTNKKQVLAANSMAKAGWDFIAKRDGVETRPYQLRMPTAEFHKTLRELDGIALGGMTPFGEAELAAAPRLRGVTRLGGGDHPGDVAEDPAHGDRHRELGHGRRVRDLSDDDFGQARP